MPVGNKHLLQLFALGGITSAQLLFYTAWERMTDENPPATHSDLGRERGMPESTRTMQDGSHLVKAMEAE